MELRGSPQVPGFSADLDAPASLYRYGRRMFAVHKNMHSAGFIGVSEAVTVRHQRSLLEYLLEKQRARSLSALRPPPPLRPPPQAHDSTRSPPLPRVKSALSLPQPRKPSPPPKDPPFASVLSHRVQKHEEPVSLEKIQKRLLSGPKYTKNHPRLDAYNPITGLKNEVAYRKVVTVRKHQRRGALFPD
jgi:hypothetical protein